MVIAIAAAANSPNVEGSGKGVAESGRPAKAGSAELAKMAPIINFFFFFNLPVLPR